VRGVQARCAGGVYTALILGAMRHCATIAASLDAQDVSHARPYRIVHSCDTTSHICAHSYLCSHTAVTLHLVAVLVQRRRRLSRAPPPPPPPTHARGIMSSAQLSSLSLASKSKKKKKVVVKVGMVGDSQIGKTSLMVKYVEGNFNEDYIQTLGQHTRRTVRGAYAAQQERCAVDAADVLSCGVMLSCMRRCTYSAIRQRADHLASANDRSLHSHASRVHLQLCLQSCLCSLSSSGCQRPLSYAIASLHSWCIRICASSPLCRCQFHGEDHRLA
jgi:hypothetical protein